ncbi:hypothetical protein B6A42_27140 (plasmid) [Vibrio coralliilyticus]|nr:hypothetical protein B6A42_27140 [Vibrio coralliilyticus]
MALRWTHIHQAFQGLLFLFGLVFAAMTTQCLVFVFWVYLVLSEHWLKLQSNSTEQWQQGLITMWEGSLAVTIKILLVVGMAFCLNKILKNKASQTSQIAPFDTDSAQK